MDDELASCMMQEDGCTVAANYLRKEERDGEIVRVLYTANCGDARTVLVFVNFYF